MAHILEQEWLTTNDVALLPKQGRIPSRSDAEISKPFLYSAPMDRVTGYHMTKVLSGLGQYPVVCRFIDSEERLACLKDFGPIPTVFFAIGLNEFEAFEKMVHSTGNHCPINVAIDVAHGDMEAVHKFTSTLKESRLFRHIMSGSICTADAARRAVNAGCTHLRVGIGPGAACTTRLMTGVGAPNLSAVYRIHIALDAYYSRDKIKVIADGGIKTPGDVVKYMAAGADGAMLGSVFSKAFESLGWEEVPVEFNEQMLVVGGPRPRPSKLIKTYRGQASAEFQRETLGQANQCPEGRSSDPFEWDGRTSAATITNEFLGGARSSVSYLGLMSTAELKPEQVTFIKVTPAGYLEGTPHGV